MVTALAELAGLHGVDSSIAAAADLLPPAAQFWSDVILPPSVLFAILLAGLGTTVLFAIALLAYRQRRTTPYLLVVGALGLLVVRTVVGFGTVFGIVPMPYHHLVEHSFDFLIAVFILAAIYLSRSSVPQVTD